MEPSQSTKPLIDSGRVVNILQECLLLPEELNEEQNGPKEGVEIVTVKVVRNYMLNKDRVFRYRDEIKTMLSNLPLAFQPDGGGGMSFLNACEDKDGNQWADMHMTMEALFVIGIAVGLAERLELPGVPVEMMPGSMPYFRVVEDK